MGITLYYNPHCSKSRRALELIRGRGIEPHVVEYLKDPPSAEELAKLLVLLGMQPRQLIRRNEADYRDAGLDDLSLGNDELIRAMVLHPGLIERPIVVAGRRAVLGRPPEKVLEIL